MSYGRKNNHSAAVVSLPPTPTFVATIAKAGNHYARTQRWSALLVFNMRAIRGCAAFLVTISAGCFTLPATEAGSSEAPARAATNAPLCEPAAIVVDAKLLNDRSLAETLREYEGWWPPEMRAYPVPLAYPGITNMADVNKTMQNALPTGLSDNAVSGTTVFALLIDVEGLVRNWKLIQRSGQRGIDLAAARALAVARFDPMLAPSGCRAVHLVRVPLSFSSRTPAP
jgi:hypothetical protein